MKITRRSPLTGIETTLDLPVTQEQLDLWEGSKVLIQDAMPHLSNPQREFLMTGFTEEDWAKIFPPEEEEDDPGPTEAWAQAREAQQVLNRATLKKLHEVARYDEKVGDYVLRK